MAISTFLIPYSRHFQKQINWRLRLIKKSQVVDDSIFDNSEMRNGILDNKGVPTARRQYWLKLAKSKDLALDALDKGALHLYPLIASSLSMDNERFLESTNDFFNSIFNYHRKYDPTVKN